MPVEALHLMRRGQIPEPNRAIYTTGQGKRFILIERHAPDRSGVSHESPQIALSLNVPQPQAPVGTGDERLSPVTGECHGISLRARTLQRIELTGIIGQDAAIVAGCEQRAESQIAHDIAKRLHKYLP